jgi:hypothetical protein
MAEADLTLVVLAFSAPVAKRRGRRHLLPTRIQRPGFRPRHQWAGAETAVPIQMVSTLTGKGVNR